MQAHAGQLVYDPVALGLDVLDVGQQRLDVLQRGVGRCLGDRREVVRQADQAEGVGDLRSGREVAEPGAGQGEGLGHGA